MNELTEIFVGETREHLEILNESLMALEQNPENREIINEIFRVVHTIKGSSAMMGLKKMENMAHGMEDVLHDIRDGKLHLDGKLVELLFVCHDFLLNCLESVVQNGDEGDFKADHIINRLHAIIQENVPSPPPPSPEAVSGASEVNLSQEELSQVNDLSAKGLVIFQIEVHFKENCQYKSVRAFLIHQHFEGVGVIIASDPPGSVLKDGNVDFEPSVVKLVLATELPEDKLLRELDYETEIERVELHLVQPVQDCSSNLCRIRLVASRDREIPDESSAIRQAVAEIIDGPTETLVEIDREFLEDFIGEIKGYLSKVESDLSELEADSDRADLIYNLYRSFHTIRGLAGFINRVPVKKLAQATETLLSRVRKGEFNLSGNVINLVLSSCDFIRRMVEDSVFPAVLTDQREYERHLSQLESPLGDGGATAVTGVPAQAEPVQPEEPLFPQPKPGRSGPMESLDEPRHEYLELHNGDAGDLAERDNKPETLPGADPERVQEQPKKNGPGPIMSGTDFARIPTVKIDGLVDKIGEMLILQSQIEQGATGKFNSNDPFFNHVLRMERLIKELQQLSMSMRMVSLRATFQKVNRVARDAISELGKNVHFILEGEETEIDRGVAEKIQDPLLHMVKNSIAHGIESEPERLQAGKPAQGVVRISAYSKKGSVYIEVTDDGRGLSVEKIHRKAVEKKLIDPKRGYREDEVLDLIFLPGFSTAETVNHISGRGVGLDVVKTEMTRIGGKIEIFNRPGKGCTFILKIPINFAAINGIITEIQGNRFIIPTLNVKQIIQPQDEQWVFVCGKRAFFKVRDEVLPVIPIAAIFGASEPDAAEPGLIILLEQEKSMKALPVTGIIGRKELVVKPLEEEFKQLQYASGVSVLGDGKLALILDIESLFKYETNVS